MWSGSHTIRMTLSLLTLWLHISLGAVRLFYCRVVTSALHGMLPGPGVFTFNLCGCLGPAVLQALHCVLVASEHLSVVCQGGSFLCLCRG